MDSNKQKYFLFGCGCAAILVVLLVIGVFFAFPLIGEWFVMSSRPSVAEATAGVSAPEITPTLIENQIEPAPIGTPVFGEQHVFGDGDLTSSAYLNQLYEEVGAGVVSVYVWVNNGQQSGQGAGSGFVYDEQGHIVTNNHVVSNADILAVVFQDGTQAYAEIVGLDPDSDLAVIKVEQLPKSVFPLPMGNSDEVLPGDWVVAIGNPFGLNSSMSIGIVSAIGRMIPSGATPFAIPLAIQTDAAINPGNSGGPLINLAGQVVGVNAQIASDRSQTNAGVGFAIPANIVRRVVPSLIDVGDFQWPWLGVVGTDVNLFIAQANQLSQDRGAYLLEVVPDGPADQAGLQGGTTPETVNGLEVPTGGDVVIALNDEPIESYADLQLAIAQRDPGEAIELTILRAGETRRLTVELAPRPE